LQPRQKAGMTRRVEKPVPPRRGAVITMNDIAEAAGVSQSTVSRILNDAPLSIPFSAKTRERVLALALEFGYRPHPIARALRGAPTMLLGAVVRDVTDLFFASAIEALSIEARRSGYSVVLGHAREQADEALALAAVLEARQCDAIVLFGDLRDEPRLIEDLRDARIPVVALWHGSDTSSDGFRKVGVDNRAGIRAALRHLSELGHRRIALVRGPALGDMREREAAYDEYMAERGTPQPPGYVKRAQNTTGGGEAALGELLALPEPPTAIVTATDVLAIGIIHAAYERGLTVPTHLSVVGFDDIPLASATVPGLTTVQMPIAKMVAAAVRLAIGTNARRDMDQASEPVIFKPKLIVRRSTSALAQVAPEARSSPRRTV
jgi:DNA-binding LacI/PurR family transcriptional regulator